MAIVETVRPIAALSSPSAAVLPSGGGHAKFTPIHSTAATAAATTAAATTAATAAVAIAAPQPRSPLVPQRRLEHESDMPMSVLNRERAKQAGEYGGAFRVYRPPRGAVRPGGDLDDEGTLARAVGGAAAEGEVMLLCIGGSGSMRAGMNLVMNFRSMGL